MLARVSAVLRSLFRSSRIDDELGEELQFHLERQVQANLEAGMSPAEARRAAALSLGGVEQIKEEAREARPGESARNLARDLAYGARLLRRSPAFAAATVAIVALGIGAVTAIFSVVYGVVLRPLPYRDPERLVSLWTRVPRLKLPRAFVNGADYRDWRSQNHVFEDIALVRHIANFNLTENGEPERVLGARVSANLFGLLGVTPALGRTFTEEEDEIGHDDVVLLSDGLWRRRFGADPSVVGRRIRLSGIPHTVVGVMRPDFRYPGREFQLWTPLTINPDELTRKVGGYSFLGVARLKPGVSVAAAQSGMDTIARRLEAAYPASNREVGVEVVPLLADVVNPVRPALLVLLGAVGCLLLIACLNLSSLLGARALSRTREFAVRRALGASRGRLAAQALAEVTPILALGGALGVAAAVWTVKAFIPLAPVGLPRVESIGVHAPVLAFSVAMLALTGTLAGVAPAVQAWRSDLAGATREGGRSTTAGHRQSKLGSLVVLAQVALTVPLLVGAGLLARSFSVLSRVDPGFRASGALSLHLAIPRSKYPKDEDVAAFCGRLLEQVAAVPGVAAVGMVNRLPLGGVAQIGSVEFDRPGGGEMTVDWRTVTPGYFDALGIPLRGGRVFTEFDSEKAPPVGVIDEQIARAIWPGESAIGKRFRIPVASLPWVEVVGVVGHVRHDGLDVDPRPQVYWNYRQRAQDRMVMVVRGRQDTHALAPAVLAAIRAVDPEQAAYDVRPMEEVLESSLAQRWLSTTLLSVFASIALLLASVGVYGVVAFGVARRTREFGIRMALGAERAQVARLVLGQGARLAGAGTLVGVVAAAILAGAMQSLVFGVPPRDALSFGGAAGVLLAVALVASYLPARRAASVDPAVTLRCE
jgi:putative ABC transport system permease protein